MDQQSEKLDYVRNLLQCSNWQLVQPISSTDNIQIDKLSIEGSNLDCFCSSGLVNVDMLTLMSYVWNVYAREEHVKEFDSDIVSYEVVEQLDDNTRLCYQINSMPWPLWSRDVLYLQIKTVVNNIGYIYMYSVDSDIKPEQSNKYVRAKINISAYVFEPLGSQCKLYRLAHVNPSGSIPASLVNRYANKTTHLIKHAKQMYN